MAPLHLDVGLNDAQLTLLVLAVNAACAAWVHCLVKHSPAGVLRVVVSVPVFTSLCALPLLWDIGPHIVVRAALMFSASWLGTFKVLAMCLNRGPLAPQRTFLQTFAIILLPIYPAGGETGKGRGRLQDEAGSSLALLARGTAKLVLLAAVIFAAMELKLPTVLRNYMLAFGMVGFLGIIMDIPASIICSSIGLKIIPTFDQPWLSTGFVDFWAKRWNITTSSVLRTVIHDVVMEGQLVKPSEPLGMRALAPEGADHHHPHHHHDHQQQKQHQAARHKREMRRILGLFITFLVSGVAHELILRNLQDTPEGPWKWKWLTFFVLQAPCVVAELWLKRWWLQRKHLPPLHPLLSRALFTCLMLALATPLFFKPADIETDTGERFLVALRHAYTPLERCVQGLASSLSVTTQKSSVEL